MDYDEATRGLEAIGEKLEKVSSKEELDDIQEKLQQFSGWFGRQQCAAAKFINLLGSIKSKASNKSKEYTKE